MILVKVQSDGVWGCGVASERCDLNNVPLGESSWTFRNDLGFYSQANKIESADIELNEGDVIGVTYDHVTLQFYLNGYSVGNGTWISLILSFSRLFCVFFSKSFDKIKKSTKRHFRNKRKSLSSCFC